MNTQTGRLDELRRWQAARLSRSYADFATDARYAPAVEFFLDELYGSRDSSARDREMARAWHLLQRTLPEAPLRALERAVELDRLSAELDREMATALPPQVLDEGAYAVAYRKVGRRESRQRQIDLVVAAGEDLEQAVRHAWAGPLLKAAHVPAHAAGFGRLQDFLERGFGAFRIMNGANELLSAIRSRETALMDAMFSGAPDPIACSLPGGHR